MICSPVQALQSGGLHGIFEYVHAPVATKIEISRVLLFHASCGFFLCSRAHALALKRMLEEHAYFGVVYGLWHKDEVSVEYGPQLFKTIPSVAKSAVFRTMIPLMRMQSKGKLLRDLNGQV